MPKELKKAMIWFLIGNGITFALVTYLVVSIIMFVFIASCIDVCSAFNFSPVLFIPIALFVGYVSVSIFLFFGAIKILKGRVRGDLRNFRALSYLWLLYFPIGTILAIIFLYYQNKREVKDYINNNSISFNNGKI